MSREVDVYLTQSELQDGERVKAQKCLHIDPALMVPVKCVSKQGVSTGTLFNAHDVSRSGSGRYLNDAEMGYMYDKFVGPSSLNNAAVRMQQHARSVSLSASSSASPSTAATPRPAAAPRSAALDSGDRSAPAPSPGMAVVMAAANSAVKEPLLNEEFLDRAAGTVGMKYVAPHIAKKYGITQHVRPPRPASAAAALAAQRAGAASAAAAAATSEQPQERQQPGASTSGAGAGSGAAAGAGHSRPPRPASASATFRGVSREQAQRTGSRFIYGGVHDTPAVGKYAPKYTMLDKASPQVDIARTLPVAEQQAAAAAAAAGGVQADPSQAVSTSNARPLRPGSAPPASAARARPTSAPSALAPHAEEEAADAHGHRRQRQQQQQAAADARAQAAARHEALFAGARRVHERPPPAPAGTQSFKAAPRKPPDTKTPAGHLFGEYYREGYDSFARKTSRPSSAFDRQRGPRTGPHLGSVRADTGPALGPGAYTPEQPPASHTGRHVNAGHSSLARTADFNRVAPRPGSAPAVRPPPASATHQGYWGPDGPATSLFPDDPEYEPLVALRSLQQRAQAAQDALYQHRAAARQAAQGQQDSGGREAGREGRGGGGGGGGGGVDERPLVYVGPEQAGGYGSAGLARRVPGGAWGSATREGAASTMRVMSDNKVIPPTAVATRTAQDLAYEYDYTTEAHRGRPPSWQLPPNRNALSQRWIASAATAYLQ